ncbi:uncharacterized protein [Panulirus ornatus]|uniref:uncharacterized protein n=1 Tax=Panulirus ornatus TaxID=150431 RepID=UPI003A84E155
MYNGKTSVLCLRPLCTRETWRADQDMTVGALASCLIRLTSGRQLYLVHDDVMPGVAGVVQTFQEMLGDTILLPYDPSILLLTEALTSNYHVQAMRNVFILCSAAHVFNIFEQVRKKFLESSTVQWFVIVDEDLTEELQVLLREGTQVALVQRVTPQTAQLFSSRVNPYSQIRFYQVGSWTMGGECTNSHQVKGGLVPDLQQLYSDFQGRQLVVSTNNFWPFFKTETLQNGSVLSISGIDLSVINTLKETLNFTFVQSANKVQLII